MRCIWSQNVLKFITSFLIRYCSGSIRFIVSLNYLNPRFCKQYWGCSWFFIFQFLCSHSAFSFASLLLSPLSGCRFLPVQISPRNCWSRSVCSPLSFSLPPLFLSPSLSRSFPISSLLFFSLALSLPLLSLLSFAPSLPPFVLPNWLLYGRLSPSPVLHFPWHKRLTAYIYRLVKFNSDHSAESTWIDMLERLMITSMSLRTIFNITKWKFSQ